jgi:alkylation response protein AidB-like acyl-CoA dehydrogenase
MADDAVTNAEQQIIDEAITFAETHVRPMAETWERERRFAAEAFAALAEAGLAGLLVPEALGGRGVGEVALTRILEELAAVDLGAAFSAVVHNNMARAVANSGNDHLIDELLPKLVSGELLGAFLLTEPGVGSDAAAITCTATQDGDEWVINGEKAWVTNASDTNALNVYATTDPDGGHRAIVSIVVDPEAPGVTRIEPYELLGAHAMGTGGFRFEDVRAPVNNTLSPVGEAFGAAMVGIDLARVLVGAMCCGMVRSSLEVALRYTGDRQLFGSAVADKQGIQWMLAEVATDLEAARLLTFRAARQLQDGEDATIMAAHAKKFAARMAEQRISDCMQVMGAAGYRRSEENPLPRHLAAAKLTGYIDGATEIQNVVIARRLWSDLDKPVTAN